MKIIYIAGPYTYNGVEENVAKAMALALDLIKEGFAPFCPHLFHFLEKIDPQPYQTWIEIDNEFVKKSDALIVIPGLSPGTRSEEALATELGIPIFNSVKDIITHFAGEHQPVESVQQ